MEESMASELVQDDNVGDSVMDAPNDDMDISVSDADISVSSAGNGPSDGGVVPTVSNDSDASNVGDGVIDYARIGDIVGEQIKDSGIAEDVTSLSSDLQAVSRALSEQEEAESEQVESLQIDADQFARFVKLEQANNSLGLVTLLMLAAVLGVMLFGLFGNLGRR